MSALQVFAERESTSKHTGDHWTRTDAPSRKRAAQRPVIMPVPPPKRKRPQSQSSKALAPIVPPTTLARKGQSMAMKAPVRRKRSSSQGSARRGGTKKQKPDEVVQVAHEMMRRQKQKRRKRLFMKIASCQVGSSSASRKGKTAIVDLRSPSPSPSPVPSIVILDGPFETHDHVREPVRTCFPLSPDPATRPTTPGQVEPESDVSPLLPLVPIPIPVPTASPTSSTSPTSRLGPTWATRPIMPLPLEGAVVRGIPEVGLEEDELDELDQDEEGELLWSGDVDKDDSSQTDDQAVTLEQHLDQEQPHPGSFDPPFTPTSTTMPQAPEINASSRDHNAAHTASGSTSSVDIVDDMIFGYRLPAGHAATQLGTPPPKLERDLAGYTNPPKSKSPFKGLTPRHTRPDWALPTGAVCRRLFTGTADVKVS